MKSYTLLFIFASMLFLSACDDEYSPIEKEQGTLDLSQIAIDVENDPLVIPSRSENDSIDISGFICRIIKAENSDTVGTWLYKSLPQSLTLTEGSYKLEVMSREPSPAEWETPFFKASKNFVIEGNKTTTIDNITCTFAAVKVTISYAPDLEKRLEGDANVEVQCGEGNLKFMQDEKRAAYFIPDEGVSTLIATFKATIKGQPVEFRKVFGDVACGQHRAITLYAKNGEDVIPPETGTMAASVYIDAISNEESIVSNLNVEETPIAPAQGEWNITFDSETIDFNKINSIDASSYIVHIHADKGISHLKVKIETNNDNFFMAVSDLLPIEFDLAYPNGRDDDFKGLGLPVGNEVIGATDVNVDISQFVPLLQAYPGLHKFHISVQDLEFHEAQRTIQFESL